VDSSDCHSKAVKAAGAAGRPAVVGSGAAVDVAAAAVDAVDAADAAAEVDDNVFAVVGCWEGRSRERTGCGRAIAGAGSKEEIWRQMWNSHRPAAGTSVGRDRRW
jgi:hypothetical protein